MKRVVGVVMILLLFVAMSIPMVLEQGLVGALCTWGLIMFGVGWITLSTYLLASG